MKLIDLLVKLANGEEVPEKIIYKNNLWYLRKTYANTIPYYSNGYDEENFLTAEENEWFTKSLNEEVEIIEDTSKEDKKIEHIKFQNNLLHNDLNIIEKLNEIIDKINGED